jgi:PhzF family phenazine biosynthesis protein
LRIPFFQVDTFTSSIFGGNPAVVCVLESWLEDSLLTEIASEHNISTTAFILPATGGAEIRFALPGGIIPFAGHATLAASYVCLNMLGLAESVITFQLGGDALKSVKRGDGRIAFDRITTETVEIEPSDVIVKALGLRPAACLQSDSQYFAIYNTEHEVRNLLPDIEAVAGLDRNSVVVTAPSERCDFVSRAFAPKEGLPEDPVCGSAHFALAPYWSSLLGVQTLHALQLSKRGGELFCELRGERMELSGNCVQYSAGTIEI